jgi:glyoxylase-like metal-dependent hydrolase (beta-lactamase superfamily II)
MHDEPSLTVVPGVERLPLASLTLPPATDTNCFLLGEERFVVVDPGAILAADQDRLVQHIKARQARGHTLVEIWLSHTHRDHIDAVPRLQRELGAEVACHAESARRVDRNIGQNIGRNIRVDRLITDGERTELPSPGGQQSWLSLYTPGHDPGHLCFYEEHSQTLLAGDMLTDVGTVVIVPPDGSMRAYIDSLKRLQTLPLQRLAPSHGQVITAPEQRLSEILAHRLAREAAIVACLTHPKTAAELVVEVYTDVDPRLYAMAEVNLRAHLDKLLDEGQVSAVGDRFFLRHREGPTLI